MAIKYEVLKALNNNRLRFLAVCVLIFSVCACKSITTADLWSAAAQSVSYTAWVPGLAVLVTIGEDFRTSVFVQEISTGVNRIRLVTSKLVVCFFAGVFLTIPLLLFPVILGNMQVLGEHISLPLVANHILISMAVASPSIIAFFITKSFTKPAVFTVGYVGAIVLASPKKLDVAVMLTIVCVTVAVCIYRFCKSDF